MCVCVRGCVRACMHKLKRLRRQFPLFDFLRLTEQLRSDKHTCTLHTKCKHARKRANVNMRMLTQMHYGPDSRTTKNHDVSTGPIACPSACLLTPLNHSLAPPCSLCSGAPLHSFVCLLTHSLAHGEVNDYIAISAVFFSVLDDSASVVVLNQDRSHLTSDKQ